MSRCAFGGRIWVVVVEILKDLPEAVDEDVWVVIDGSGWKKVTKLQRLYSGVPIRLVKCCMLVTISPRLCCGMKV